MQRNNYERVLTQFDPLQSLEQTWRVPTFIPHHQKTRGDFIPFEQYHSLGDNPTGIASPVNFQGPTLPAHLCPHCHQQAELFVLNHDHTDTVYCQSCKQPCHMCPIHKTLLKGHGYSLSFHHQNQAKCQCPQIGSNTLFGVGWDSAFQ